jgi:AmmeMemoRadiSam system protein B
MKKKILPFPVLILSIFFLACNTQQNKQADTSIRNLIDTVGFASKAYQMDSIISRINNTQGAYLENIIKSTGVDNTKQWKVCISPHDDYSYVGYLYPAVLNYVKATTLIIFGVAHKARKLGLENKIIFDSFTSWHAPYGDVKTSSIRDKIISALPKDVYIVNNQMQSMEHSVEALIPFLQCNNRNIEIVSILVPYMSFDRMKEIAMPLALKIKKVVTESDLEWGKDFAFIISTDAVHYGDEGWGESDFSFYGTDSAGYNQAINHELKIINDCLIGSIELDKIRKFTNYTVMPDDYKKYIWTWCGRYSVPFGLLTTYYLQNQLNEELNGFFIGYSTSIDHEHIKVDDINMGITAPANDHHWVGYAAVGYY